MRDSLYKRVNHHPSQATNHSFIHSFNQETFANITAIGKMVVHQYQIHTLYGSEAKTLASLGVQRYWVMTCMRRQSIVSRELRMVVSSLVTICMFDMTLIQSSWHLLTTTMPRHNERFYFFFAIGFFSHGYNFTFFVRKIFPKHYLKLSSTGIDAYPHRGIIRKATVLL